MPAGALQLNPYPLSRTMVSLRHPSLRHAAALLLVSSLVGCHRAPMSTMPIPLADRPPWQAVVTAPGFRIAMDTAHIAPSAPGTWLVSFVTTHAQPQGPDSMRFDRGRIRLLIRCDSAAFKSVSEELALGDARPVFHEQWPLAGPQAVTWRGPAQGSTDAQLLDAACALLRRHGAA